MSLLMPHVLGVLVAAAQPQLTVSLDIGRAQYGTWETIEFDFSVSTVKASNAANGDRHDRYRRGNLAGKIVKLRGAMVRTFDGGSDIDKHPPRFIDEKLKAHTYLIYDRGIDVTSIFGKLKPGAYTLQIVVPAGRTRVDGELMPELASPIVKFDVFAEDRAASVRALDVLESDIAGVSLEVVPDPKSGPRGYRITVSNRSKEPLQYTAGDSLSPPDLESIEEPCARFYGEALALQGTWRGFAVDGCIRGKPFTLGPGERATYRAWLPEDEKDARYVRFMLIINEDDRRPRQWTRSIGFDRGARTP